MPGRSSSISSAPDLKSAQLMDILNFGFTACSIKLAKPTSRRKK
jgi:hypothetical protein